MTLSGSIDEIRFRNDENGYTIVVLDVDGEPVVCVGSFPPLSEGEFLTVNGNYVVHPRFGKQFKAESAEVKRPDSLDGIIRYLGSGLIRGVGPKTALAIVSAYGKDTLKILETNPLKLAKIKGISKTKAADIGDSYAAVKVAREEVMFLQNNGISLGLSMKIYAKYGSDTRSTVSSDPYKLIEDIEGVGFITADRIARSVGIAADSEKRIRAGLLHTLSVSGERNGNTYLPAEILFGEAMQLLGAGDEDAVTDAAESLVIDRKLKRVKVDGDDGYMLFQAFRAERGVAERLVRIIGESNAVRVDCSDEVRDYENVRKIKLNDMQKKAIDHAVNDGVCIITGGPGTGKTTIVRCVLEIFSKRGLKTLLMAPTGRAAKRLSESTGTSASTIHRALGRHNDDGEMLPADAVIVDEVSMMDVYLTDMLLKRLRPETKLIFVGDKDQLPSVGAGNVLADLIACGLIGVVKLENIYRQSGESLIITNAHEINSGRMPELKRKDADFFFMYSSSPERTADIVCGLVSERLPKYLSVEPDKIQVLCPMKNGAAGSVNLNKRLQARLNPGSGGIENDPDSEKSERFRVGDRVMHTANNYNIEWARNIFPYDTGEGIFNGDLGKVTAINLSSGETEVTFEDGRVAKYTSDVISQLTLAYAITVHKSQGSEFEAVVIPVAGANPVIMTRNLLYTAITRAKRLVVIVGEEYNVKRMVDNNYIAKRYSMLQDFIHEQSDKNALLYGAPPKD